MLNLLRPRQRFIVVWLINWICNSRVNKVNLQFHRYLKMLCKYEQKHLHIVFFLPHTQADWMIKLAVGFKTYPCRPHVFWGHQLSHMYPNIASVSVLLKILLWVSDLGSHCKPGPFLHFCYIARHKDILQLDGNAGLIHFLWEGICVAPCILHLVACFSFYL